METNNNSKFNFYTQNGWAGSNYDRKLGAKEVAVKVRAFAKKNFPGFKFSVRSEWSMYTDSMYIELKEGTCLPFVEGSRSAERGYMDTMNTVKGWEKELTPEMFKVLDAVTIYANSFRYDDSDGMQDYFDTNFYLKIKVSDEYKVTEPKAKKSSIKPEKAEEAKEVEAVTVKNIEVVDYSEKAIAVFGDTKAIKEQLKELGGRFNPSLKHNGEKRAGWIFSKKQTDKVRLLLSKQKETKDTAPVKATNEESEISQKKGYYTKDENGYKVESYFTKDKTALEELIEINNQQSIREIIEAKERAFSEASENAEFYRSIGNDEFADTEQTRANRLKKDLDQLRQTLPTEPIKPTGSDANTEPLERVEVQTVTYRDSEISQFPDHSEATRATYQTEPTKDNRYEQSEGVSRKNKAGITSGFLFLCMFCKIGQFIFTKILLYPIRLSFLYVAKGYVFSKFFHSKITKSLTERSIHE